jgi:hypothetical protein
LDRADDGDDDVRSGDGGEDATKEDSEELRLAVSLDSPPLSMAEVTILLIVGAAEEVLFLAGRRGISFPGNSLRNYYQQNITGR